MRIKELFLFHKIIVTIFLEMEYIVNEREKLGT